MKLFYYQTFFETWRNEHSWYEHYKNAIKIWGHRACLRVSRLFKIGYFYWLRVKSLNHLHAELNLGYLKGTKFCLESKASFIDISSSASFKPFLIAWLRYYFSFSDSSVVNLKSSRWPKYAQLGTIFQKKSRSTIKLFFLFQYVLHYTVLSKYLKKKLGVTVLVYEKRRIHFAIELSLREASYVL